MHEEDGVGQDKALGSETERELIFDRQHDFEKRHRVRNGRFTEEYTLFNELQILQQLWFGR